MRKLLLSSFLLFIFCLSCIVSLAQTDTWTWIKGDTIPNTLGNYGVQGVPSPLNEPLARYACGFWTDTTGNLWIFGGYNNIYISSNDLWKFDPQILQWTWMTGDSNGGAENINAPQGVYDPLNTPGMLRIGMFCWVTSDNHLWLFGGLTIDNITNDELWQYNPGINQWAWMGTFGPVSYGIKGIGNNTTMPDGRCEGNTAWTDSAGNLWLFGGQDANYYSYNDMWKYNVTTGIWTWMSGSSQADNGGSYGTIGQPSVNNYPSARSTNLFWKDSIGNFWLVGGTQHTRDLMFQDVWKFNPSSLQWTWIKGPRGEDTTSNNTANCVADTSNESGPRYENRVVWKMCDDLVLTYNGFSDWNAGLENINDMWAYRPNENEWIKINTWGYQGSYGTQAVTDPANYPPSRFGSAGFKDKNNNLWMFGGWQQVSSGNRRVYNDLWKYVPDNACIGNLVCGNSVLTALHDSAYSNAASCNTVCNGSGGVAVTGGTAPYTYRWQPRGDTTAAISGLCTGTYYVTITDANNSVITDSIQIVAPIMDPVPISVDKYVFCSGDSAHLCAPTGFKVYAWSDKDSTACTSVTATGIYSVTIKDANGCIIPTGTVPITVYRQPVDSVLADTSAICFGDSVQLCSLSGFSSQLWNTGDTSLCIQVKEPGDYYTLVTDNNGCTASTDTFNVAVYPVPLDNIYATKDTFCSGDSVAVCAESSFFTYQWNVGGTDSCVYATNAGNYYVTLTDANGCTALSNRVAVFVYPVPSVSVIVLGDTLTSYGQVGYQWYYNNALVPGATKSIYIAPHAGEYSVGVTDTNGCVTISNPVLVTGVENLPPVESISVYPNPNAVGSWQLTVGNELLGSTLEVFDEQGRLIYQSTIRDLKSDITLGVASGIYYLHISNTTISIVRMLVKM